jgi:hypothetical protein
MPVAEASIRTLLDREVMLSCLVEAVRDEPADGLAGEFGRQVLEVRIRSTRARRGALLHSAQARAMREEVTPRAHRAMPRVADAVVISRLATARLTMELRRVDLAMSLADAAELRTSARALRGEARQIRVRGRQPYR